ncbi:MAG: aldehyde-activating protein [Betaproteobacteria bacterium]|nr:aldehyde-activating protein [Betaproteobacteria bacterium]
MTNALIPYLGGCHCGALAFEYRTALAPASWSVRECQCGFCRAHGATTTSDVNGELTFEVRDAQALRRYRFGSRTADFLLCEHCGVYLGVQMQTARGACGIINLRALRAQPAGLPGAAATHLDGEATEQRIARRESRWTPMTALV